MQEHEMTVDIIRAHSESDQRLLALKNSGGTKYLPIWIGRNEAEAIAASLRGIAMSRPLTHDLLLNIITGMGGKISRVIVSKLEGETFYAKIEIQMSERTLEMDARPSDAIALSVRATVPIYVADEVLNKAGIEKETEEEDEESSKDPSGNFFNLERPKPVGKKEREQLTAFESFIESLDIADLGEKSDTDTDAGGK